MIGNMKRELEAREHCESNQISMQMQEKGKKKRLNGRVLDCSVVLRKLGKTKVTYQRNLASLRDRPSLVALLHLVKVASG